MLWLGTFLSRFAAAFVLRGPYLVPDEVDYWQMARSFWHTGHFRMYHSSMTLPNVLYPLLISPAFLWHQPKVELFLVRLISGLVMAATVFPAYGLAREFLSQQEALFAALLVALVPSGIYSSTVMAENLFFPLAVLTIWICFKTLTEGRLWQAVAAGLLFIVGFYVKIQQMFFVVAYAVPVALWAFSELTSHEGRRNWKATVRGALLRALPGFMFLGLIAFLWAMGRVHNVSLSVAVFGNIYSSIANFNGHLDIVWFLASVLGLLEALSISTLFLPMAAFFASLGIVHKLPRRLRTFWWLMVSSLTVYLVMVARHNALHDGILRVHERYLFVINPLLWIWFFTIRKRIKAWLLYPVALVIAGICCWSLITVRPEHLLSWGSLEDSATFTLFFHLQQHWASPWPRFLVLLMLALFAAAGAYLLNGRRMRAAAMVWAVGLLLLDSGWYVAQSKDMSSQLKADVREALYLRRTIPQDASLAVIYNRYQHPEDQMTMFYMEFWLENPMTYYVDDPPPGPLSPFERPLPKRDGKPAFREMKQPYVIWIGKGGTDLPLIKEWPNPPLSLYSNNGAPTSGTP